jgi:hypothetical protein
MVFGCYGVRVLWCYGVRVLWCSVKSDSKLQTPNSKPETPKLQTRNSKPETLNPKLQTRNSLIPRLAFLCLQGQDGEMGVVGQLLGIAEVE